MIEFVNERHVNLNYYNTSLVFVKAARAPLAKSESLQVWQGFTLHTLQGETLPNSENYQPYPDKRLLRRARKPMSNNAKAKARMTAVVVDNLNSALISFMESEVSAPSPKIT